MSPSCWLFFSSFKAIHSIIKSSGFVLVCIEIPEGLPGATALEVLNAPHPHGPYRLCNTR